MGLTVVSLAAIVSIDAGSKTFWSRPQFQSVFDTANSPIIKPSTAL